VLEYAKGGTLKDYLKKSNIPKQFAFQIMSELADGLKQIHDMGVTHKDSETKNILLMHTNPSSKETVVKYSDFGISNVKEYGGLTFSYSLKKDVADTLKMIKLVMEKVEGWTTDREVVMAKIKKKTATTADVLVDIVKGVIAVDGGAVEEAVSTQCEGCAIL
jgi:serine/threonine protein kinase